MFYVLNSKTPSCHNTSYTWLRYIGALRQEQFLVQNYRGFLLLLKGVAITSSFLVLFVTCLLELQMVMKIYLPMYL